MSKEQENMALKRWILGILSLSLFGGALAIVPLHAQNHGDHQQQNSQLVEDVRNATRQFLDVNSAVRAGYDAAFGCVSGPDHGPDHSRWTAPLNAEKPLQTVSQGCARPDIN